MLELSIEMFFLYFSGCGRSCLLVSNANSIIVVNTDTLRTRTLIPRLRRAVALDGDTVRGYIYWSDINERVIRRANLDGSNTTTLFNQGVGVCDGLVIDKRAGKLYWTDTTFNKIEVADLYTHQRARRVLFNVGLDEPRGIAVELDQG